MSKMRAGRASTDRPTFKDSARYGGKEATDNEPESVKRYRQFLAGQARA